jgi:hypothetical protein
MKTGLVILTDGYTNLGIQDENGLRSLVSMMHQAHQNLSVSCVGYGFEHQGDLLRNLALEGGGSYNIVHIQDHVGPVFGEILGGLVSCVAQNVEVVYPHEYENYTSYISREDGNSRRLFVGDIYSESETIVLLKRVGQELGVTLKGFNCVQMEDVSMPLQWSVANLDGQGPYRMFYIRWALAKILERASGSTSGTAANRENLLSDIDSLEQLLEGEGDMVALMRSEFAAARNMIQNHEVMNETAYLQRSMYLASGRGAATQSMGSPLRGRSSRRVTRSGFSQDPADIVTATIPPPGASPFMNAAQRSISAAMSQVPR